jgi:hypothetical protein
MNQLQVKVIVIFVKYVLDELPGETACPVGHEETELPGRGSHILLVIHLMIYPCRTMGGLLI